VSGDGLSVYELVNRFLESKELLVKNGEMTPRHWENCKIAGGKLIDFVGRRCLVASITPSDFGKLREDFAKTHGAHALSNDIARVRSFFNWGYKQGLLERPVVYGEFTKPKKAVMRRARQNKGPRFFRPGQIRSLLDKAAHNSKQ
jgi:integrase